MVKVYVKGEVEGIDFGLFFKIFVMGNIGVVFGEWKEIKVVIEVNEGKIEDYVIENDCCNFVIFLLDMKGIKVCIELGVIICD